jgi:uncharacterized membrane-anchored protein
MSRSSCLVPALLSGLLLLVPLVTDAETEEEKSHSLMRSIRWEEGPCVGRLGTLAQIQVPAGMAFTGADGTKKWMEATHNLANDDMLGVVVPDDEKNALDAGAILKSIQTGNVEANKERRKRGWHEVEVVGWDREPFYNESSHNLTWAIRGRSPSGETVNYNVRMLGREGYMSAELILGPDQLAATVGPFENLLGGYTYTSGHRYAEYRQGDKLAKYGLTALVAGGVGAVAAKTGLLAKFWKLIVVAFVALAAAIRRFFSALFRREDPPPKMPEIK